MDDVDYEFWLKKENWSELEARFLLTGLTPFYAHKLPFLSSSFFFDKDDEEIEEIQERFKDKVERLTTAISEGWITQVNYEGDRILVQGGGWNGSDMDVMKITRYFEKTDILKFAVEEGFDIPKELFNWYIKWQSHTTKEVSTLARHPNCFSPFKTDDTLKSKENNQDLKAELELVKSENEVLKKQLAEFQSSENLDPREKSTLLKIIAVMAKENYSDLVAEPFALGEQISKQALQLKIDIKPKLIGYKIKDAKNFL